jgi:hypothetical protein
MPIVPTHIVIRSNEYGARMTYRQDGRLSIKLYVGVTHSLFLQIPLNVLIDVESRDRGDGLDNIFSLAKIRFWEWTSKQHPGQEMVVP